MLQIEHRHNWRNAVCIALIAFCVSAVRAQLPAAVGPVRLSISPANPAAIPNGKSLKLAVLENFFRNGSQSTGVRDISSHVTAWSSSDPTTISVGSRGLAIAHQPSGTAVIAATVRAPGWPGQISITLSAAPAVLQFIVVTPFKSKLAVSGTLQYTATGHYSDGTTMDLTSAAGTTWGVINSLGGTSGQAAVSGTGLVTGQIAGVVEITAANSGITGGTYLNVGLTSFSITPSAPDPTVAKGQSQQFVATGTLGATSGVDITNYVKWSSSTSSVATITGLCGICSGGLASTFAQGTSTISASSGSITSSNTPTLTVGPAIVTSIAISPSNCNPTSVPRGNSCQFTAVATYSDRTTASFTDIATWNSDNMNSVVVSATALATTLNPPSNPPGTGSANITATYTNINPPNDLVTSNSIALNVTPHVLNSISVSPKTPTQPKGTPQQFTVKAHYSDGTVTVTNGGGGPSWSSSNSSVATIGASSGSATTVNAGTTTISASYSGLAASTTFTVTAAALSSIAVTAVNPVATNPASANATIPIAGMQQFKAIGTYTDSSTQDLTSSVTWSSSTGAAAFNDPDSPGLATGVSAGGPTITATDPNTGKTGTAPLTVAAINFITVSPPSATINAGQTQAFTATANYGSSTQLLTAFGPIWSSNHTNIATVDQNGIATAISSGAATITAALGGIFCTGVNCAALTVNQPILQSITVACDPNAPCTNSGEPVLQLGQTEQMIATGNYSDGSTQDLTQTTGLTWASTNTGVATIDTKGFLTTKGFGSTNITATCLSGGGCPGATSTVQGSLSLTVTF